MPKLLCSSCKISKSVHNFASRPGIKRGFEYNCKKCTNSKRTAARNTSEYNRKYRLMREYGLTTEQYEVMLASQDYRCAICNVLLDDTHIDHNHEFGFVRGILCRGCNVGLGMFKDNIEYLKAAILYLQEHEV